MDKLDLNTILERNELEESIINLLDNFYKNKQDLTITRGLYLYGHPGSGKTLFIENVLKKINVDTILFNAGDIRNNNIISDITKYNMSNVNVISMFKKEKKNIVIVMDEIDGMNNGDKGGINSLIKIIRPKKTKKQKTEDYSLNPIICIGNYHVDKKIRELMKVCVNYELKSPTNKQMEKIIGLLFTTIDENTKECILQYSQNDLRKLKNLHDLYLHNNNNSYYNKYFLNEIIQLKSYNEDIKITTKLLLNNHYSMNEHIKLINETDRTIIALLWHENIIDLLSKYNDNTLVIPIYLKLLNNICFADYIDRVTFQKQIWQFNEMTSLIKTMCNNKLYHEYFDKKYKFNPHEVRFTKVLTKYSTEYNNSIFIFNLTEQLTMDKKDLLTYFNMLKNEHSETEILNIFENVDIQKLDINRMLRFVNKFIDEDINDINDINDTLDNNYDIVDNGN
jgi:SpoVK/Ycf46/Vps4 family AAA+-type ATPase